MIPDLDQVIEAYRLRQKHRGHVLWDEDKEFERWKKKMDSGFASYYEFPNSPYYKNGKALIAESLTSQLKKMEHQIQEIRKEQDKIKRMIKKKQKTSVMSFMEAVEARNSLSAADLRTHSELQQKAMRWLFNQGYVVVSELVIDNGRRVDVIGFNKEKRIVIIEVKASRSDLLGDEKWTSYLDTCDAFYFCTPPYVVNWNHEKQLLKDKAKAGLLLPVKRGATLEVAVSSSLSPSAKNRQELIFQISRMLSKKFIFGF
ncbi:MmcB family DNA repair protein [Paenibacillus periandrae]|uniref:MmcB family DNA repair protein n=1 Tax=Paenibacillus periandrae TaxID=1761741 RepID=UPI001F092307